MPVIVPFSDAEPVVGHLEPDDRTTKGFGNPSPPGPLDTYVMLGATTVTPLTSSTTGLDPAIQQIIAGDAEKRYFHVRFSCTFHLSGSDTFEKAWVTGTLGAAAEQPAPIAVSLDPLRSEHAVELTEGFELGVDFKFLSAKVTGGTSIPSALIFVEALNEGSSEPSWEFTQTSAERLSGLQRLEMIVRTGKSGGTGALTLTANVGRPQLGGAWIYRARFEDQPSITFAMP